MGETNIEWTDYTWNPWSGCQKVSQGCKNCYAAVLPPSMRRRAEWGADTPRIEASEEYWREPITWDRKAENEGVRRKVFCASTADIGEARPELDAWRDRALALVALTPNLDWLWLTKRPEYLAGYFAAPDLYRRVLDAANFFRYGPESERGIRKGNDRQKICITDPTRELPRNLWVGTSVEDQAATTRIDALRRIPARVRFLSMEPLLGAVDVSPWLGRPCECEDREPWRPCRSSSASPCTRSVDWVIVGGESGRNARPMHPRWAQSLRDQCERAGVLYFFKQWGEWKPISQMTEEEMDAPYRSNRIARDGEDQAALDDSYGKTCTVPQLVIRDNGEHRETDDPLAFSVDAPGGHFMAAYKVGKDKAGRLLDGCEWNEVPQ